MSQPRLEGFALGECMGRGAFAEVWAVTELSTWQRYACKCISKDDHNYQKAVQLFKREIRALKALSHPSIVRFKSYVETKRHFCIIEELCEGKSLAHLLSVSRILEEDFCRDILGGILSALNHVHTSGFVHGDVKPSNILFTTIPTVKLVDFGCSESIDIQDQSGTFYYQPPELNEPFHDRRKADIWSCGIMLFEMLTGKIPWKGSSELDVLNEKKTVKLCVDSVSDGCRECLAALTDIDPIRRPTANEALELPWFQTNRPIARARLRRSVASGTIHKLEDSDIPPQQNLASRRKSAEILKLTYD